ncbi:hypothetical protein DUNSADRAFT_11584 [Dunaliella salina]|uniref:Uncharacterized protein n=1 Tax=Dunaliella salina TaxID=3046 RepID=A0ABQ7GD41_DUNSA|nr:hypothetical protein DUNSADRAFT_11584 [Dunaliella salina]|eukprot:KAF5832512.1 hypothetical protein DUNSADRAFT_11584 [Dunaliella salina]
MVDKDSQMELRDSYAQEHHSVTPGSTMAKAVATAGRRAGIMGDLGAEETADRELTNHPLFLAGYPERPGVICNDPVATEVQATGVPERDVDVTVKLQDGSEVAAQVRLAAADAAASEQAAKSVAASAASQ